MSRVIVLLSVLALLVVAVPAAAQPTSPWPTGDGFAGHGRRSTQAGPAAPGVAWTTSASEIDVGADAVFRGVSGTNDDHGYDMVADTQGHVLVQGDIDPDGDASTQNILLALNAEDGSQAWTTDPAEVGVESTCSPVIDSDGDLWVMADRTEDLGTTLPLQAPTQLDQSDGTVIGQALDTLAKEDFPDTRDGNGCSFPPTLTPDDLLVVNFRTFNQPLVAVDLTDGSLAWTTDLRGQGVEGPVSWAVATPDGERVLVGIDDDPEDEQVMIIAVSTADGSIIDSTTVAGYRYFTVLNENPVVGLPDGSVVFGTDTRDLTGRMIRMNPDLSTEWDVATVTEGPADALRPLGTLAWGGPNGDYIIGWSISSPSDIYAVSVVDGSLVWSSDPAGFDSTPSMTVDSAGRAYVGVFGTSDDPRLQVIGPDGTPGATLAGTALTEDNIGGSNLTGIGPIVDGQLIVVGGTSEDTVFIGVDNSGGGLVPGVSRPAGTSDDPRQIAIDLCQYLNPEPDSVRAVILAQDEIFADALTGSPLAGDDGCVLFTGRAPEGLDPRTATEIDRALPDGGTVYLLGGNAAVSDEVATTLASSGFDVQRLAGPGRIETAVAIADEVQLLNPDNTAAMLAFEGNWPDAVAGGAYGAETGTPILLTRTESIPPQTQTALDRHAIDDVTMLGSTVVIGQAVEDALTQPSVDRAGGSNRMSTAVAIAERLWLADTDSAGDTFLVVNLEAPDAWTIALAAAPLSAREDAPQLGVGNTRYPTETEDFLAAQGFEELPSLGLIGGLAFIGADIEGLIDDSIMP